MSVGVEYSLRPLPEPKVEWDALPHPLPAHVDLAHKVSRLAVVHGVESHDSFYTEPANDEPLMQRPASGYSFGQVVERGHDAVLPRGVAPTPEARQKEGALRAIRAHLVEHSVLATESHPTDRQQDVIHWGRVAQSLLDEAERVEDANERRGRLVGGVIASQFAKDDNDRKAFVLSVYDRNLQAEAAAACADSPLTIVVDAPGAGAWGKGEHRYHAVDPVKRYADVFRIDPDRMRTFVARMDGEAAEQDKGPAARSPKQLQKDLATRSPDSDAAAAAQQQAGVASVGGEKVRGAVLDPLKIERFGLQEHFLKQQFEALLGTSVEEVTNSVLAQYLRDTRNTPDTTTVSAQEVTDDDFFGVPPPQLEMPPVSPIDKLTTDAQAAFRRASAPIIERYSLEGVATDDPSQLTVEQKYAARYLVVNKLTQQELLLSQYINYEEFVERARDEPVSNVAGAPDIWSNSEDGAAAPDAAADIMATLMNEVASNGYDGPPLNVTSEELLQLLQQNRRVLLTIATRNIAEFFDADRMVNAVRLSRDENDMLQMSTTSSDVASKESLDVYAAITLGCPALREIHPGRQALTMEQRLAHGSSNYIDHALAAIFNEAYERGALDVAAYREFQEDRARRAEAFAQAQAQTGEMFATV
ncbi:MAG TPA: hypothetical protein VLH84_01400 [Patescibacteria group bacterium]|nr:hypothetical protein [Patescibacteria group bacterium]